MKNKISIIMPTYNDERTIEESLLSITSQIYNNWELIIIDDGSTDSTSEIIKKFKKTNDKEDKIKYFYQNNSDQLNAIKLGLEKVTGEYIFIFHSDDLLPSPNTFLTFADELDNDQELDSVIGNLIIINDNGERVGIDKVPPYNRKTCTAAKLLVLFGSNFYSDCAFHRKKVFEEKIKQNYLDWDTVFWIDFSNKNPKLLNIKKINQPILKYRVGDSNYNRDKIGKHNVLTGEMRTTTKLLNYFSIPNFKLTSKLFFFLLRHKKIFAYFPIVYRKKPTKNKAKLIDYLIKKRYCNDYSDNIWLTSLVSFFRNKYKRTILFPKTKESDVFIGSDMRSFTKQLFSHALPSVYYYLFDEMRRGFDEIIVTDEVQYERCRKITQFICIESDIKITIKKEKN